MFFRDHYVFLHFVYYDIPMQFFDSIFLLKIRFKHLNAVAEEKNGILSLRCCCFDKTFLIRRFFSRTKYFTLFKYFINQIFQIALFEI